MNTRNKFLVVWLIMFASSPCFSQGVSINTTGAAADASALLDASSTTQGFLVPRITSAQRAAISNPATGLTVYQTDGTAGYYYNGGTPASPSWNQLLQVPSSAPATGDKLIWNGSNWVPVADGAAFASGIQYYDISGTATTFNSTITDLSVRVILLDAKTRTLSTSMTHNVTLPSASSYPAGTLIYIAFQNYTGAPPITYLQSPSSTYTAIATNNINISTTPLALNIGQGCRLISDGVSKWFRLNN